MASRNYNDLGWMVNFLPPNWEIHPSPWNKVVYVGSAKVGWVTIDFRQRSFALGRRKPNTSDFEQYKNPHWSTRLLTDATVALFARHTQSENRKNSYKQQDPDVPADGQNTVIEAETRPAPEGEPDPKEEKAPEAIPAPAALPSTPRKPDGYAFRYPSPLSGGTVIRFNGGEAVNGSAPIEAVPYWLGEPDHKDWVKYYETRIAELTAAMGEAADFMNDIIGRK